MSTSARETLVKMGAVAEITMAATLALAARAGLAKPVLSILMNALQIRAKTVVRAGTWLAATAAPVARAIRAPSARPTPTNAAPILAAMEALAQTASIVIRALARQALPVHNARLIDARPRLAETAAAASASPTAGTSACAPEATLAPIVRQILTIAPVTSARMVPHVRT